MSREPPSTNARPVGNGVESCSDGNGCTVGDTCTAGQCVSGAAVTCDDNDACTTEACNPSTGQCQTTSTVTCGAFQTCDPTTGQCTYDVGGSSCVQDNSISTKFNGTPINPGTTIWFNSTLNASGVGKKGANIRFDQSTIQFTANGVSYTVAVPDAIITISPTATSASTTFDTAANAWRTTVPLKLDGNYFLDGIGFPVPVRFPGGVGLSWRWGAAVYSKFSTDPNALGVKPVDGDKLNPYHNGDKAGTPENFTKSVIGGALGGGGANYTGGYTPSQNVCTKK